MHFSQYLTLLPLCLSLTAALPTAAPTDVDAAFGADWSAKKRDVDAAFGADWSAKKGDVDAAFGADWSAKKRELVDATKNE